MDKNSPEDTIGEVNNTQSNVKFHYTWKINNFSGIIYNGHKTGFDSPIISTKMKPEYHFKLRIMLYYSKKEDFGIALMSYNDTALEIKCSISLINANINKNYKTTGTSVYNRKGFGWTILIVKMSDVEKILINDEITILCEIEIDMNSKCNKQLTDANIIINDKKFFVHKDILANSSDVFDAMFKHDMKENQENLIEIKDIEWRIFNLLLQYVYLKKHGFDANNCIKVLAAADKYAIEELKNICENNLCENITLTNVFKYLKVTDKYILNKLKKEAIAFIKLHKSQLAENNLMHSIADLPKDVLIEVVTALCNE